MSSLKNTLQTRGEVTGPYAKEMMVCQYTKMINSKSIWFGDDIFDFSFPVLAAQIAIIILVTRITYLVVKPLQQSMTTAHIIAGLIIGPSFLAHNSLYKEKLFPPGGKVILQVLAQFGYTLHLFILGVQIDASILKKAGSNAVLIGAISYALPYALGGLSFLVIRHIVPMEEALSYDLISVVGVNSVSCFPVITTLLSELNILNSDIGRLATYTSMVSDSCGWFMSAVLTTVGIGFHHSQWTSIIFAGWLLLFLVTIVFILRPTIIWLSKRNVKGELMEEIQFFAILIMLLGCAFCAEVLGQHASFGAFVLGIALPDGPPIGTSVVNKLDTMATALFLPVFFAFCGLQTNLFLTGGKYALIIELIIFVGYLAKFTGTSAAALYCGLPFREALSLGLIMCCKGVIEVATYSTWRDTKIIDIHTFNLLIITMLIVTGFARPMIIYLYDPSRRYMAYARRTILHSKHDMQFRILACIHHEDNVPTIINLLEASNPTRNSPISIFVLHLKELKGRASSILVPHHNLDKLNANASRSEHIVNAFNYYEQQHHGSAVVQHITAVAPYASIHDDICTLAVDKRTTIVIVPFHKNWSIDGTVGSTIQAIRHVNRNVMDKAPCSVGVLIDRSQVGGKHSGITNHSTYCIALLFLGGADDREALAYCKRMAEHPNIRFTLFRLKNERYNNDKDRNLDNELVGDIRLYAVGKERIIYKEEIVKDSVETTQVIRSLEYDFDLVIVGKHHDPESPLILGLTEWSECPELGVIGDMLVTSDFPFSVLVVQQQALVETLLSSRTVDSSWVFPDDTDEEDIAPSRRV